MHMYVCMYMACMLGRRHMRARVRCKYADACAPGLARARRHAARRRENIFLLILMLLKLLHYFLLFPAIYPIILLYCSMVYDQSIMLIHKRHASGAGLARSSRSRSLSLSLARSMHLPTRTPPKSCRTLRWAQVLTLLAFLVQKYKY